MTTVRDVLELCTCMWSTDPEWSHSSRCPVAIIKRMEEEIKARDERIAELEVELTARRNMDQMLLGERK